MIQQAMSNLKNLHFGGASSVIDPELQNTVYDIIIACCQQDILNDITVQSTFLDSYQTWIRNSKLNQLHGLDSFPVAAYANGTTEGFDKFMLKNRQRRFRCFRGEYMYHPAAWRNYFPGWCRIEDEPLDVNDAVIISMPFSDTGDIHPETMSVLDQCDSLGIPVLIDSAFFGICHGIKFNYDRQCITDITFSLSKSFPVANLRIGMRLTKQDDDDTLMIHNKTNYNNRMGAGVGAQLLEKYSADYNVHTWQGIQEKFCREIDVSPSKSVIFGLGGENFIKYNRGGTSNRLCFSRYLYQGRLPNDRHRSHNQQI
jgi:hypothetical protein